MKLMEQSFSFSPKTKGEKNEQLVLNKPTNETTVSSSKYVVWHIQGGLGKNVAGTALPKSIKDRYKDRKLILVCSYPEIFLNNPYVDRVYQLGQAPHFYEDYIDGKDTIIFRHEPYHQSGHITRENHIIKSWCELMDIPYNGQTPKLYPNYIQKMITGIWQRNKPVMVLQTNGGPKEGGQYNYSWTRDMPMEVAQEIVKKYSQQYHIIQVTRQGGYELQGVERLDGQLSNMELFALLASSQKRVLIDSCLQHAAMAMNLKSTVLWIGTSPNNFGYDFHTNILAKPTKRMNQLIGSYLFDYQFDKNAHECPYNDVSEIFDVKDILNHI